MQPKKPVGRSRKGGYPDGRCGVGVEGQLAGCKASGAWTIGAQSRGGGKGWTGRAESRGFECGPGCVGPHWSSHHPCSCRLSLSWAGYPIPKPDLIFHLEQGKEPWVEDSPHPEEGDVVTGVYTGEWDTSLGGSLLRAVSDFSLYQGKHSADLRLVLYLPERLMLMSWGLQWL